MICNMINSDITSTDSLENLYETRKYLKNEIKRFKKQLKRLQVYEEQLSYDANFEKTVIKDWIKKDTRTLFCVNQEIKRREMPKMFICNKTSSKHLMTEHGCIWYCH